MVLPARPGSDEVQRRALTSATIEPFTSIPITCMRQEKVTPASLYHFHRCMDSLVYTTSNKTILPTDTCSRSIDLLNLATRCSHEMERYLSYLSKSYYRKRGSNLVASLLEHDSEAQPKSTQAQHCQCLCAISRHENRRKKEIIGKVLHYARN